MIPAWLCLLLLACWAAGDDSVVTRSALEDTSYRRSVITNSELSQCRVDRSGLQGSLAKGSVLVYSHVGNSTVTGSVLNATYPDSRLDGTPSPDVFRNVERYYFNRIFDSEIVNAMIDASPNCLCDEPGYNSTVYLSRIMDSSVHHSQVILSNLTDASRSCLSVIGLSDLCRTVVSNSVIRKSKVKSCTLSNTVAESSHCVDSTVANGELSSSTVLNSTFANSDIKKDSQAINSAVKNSVISSQSKVFDSRIINSKVFNSKLRNCIIINSNVVDETWDSVKVINGIVRNDRNDKLAWFHWAW